MKKLKKFSKNENINKRLIMIAVAFMLVGIVLLETSYAVYQTEAEIQFINATVRWPNANEVTYTIENNENITSVEEALNDLYERFGS